jgi:hypothetical protein
MMTVLCELVTGEAGCAGEAGCWEACLLLAEWLSRTDSGANGDRPKNK